MGRPIPRTLAECFDHFQSSDSPDELAAFKALPEEHVARYHAGWGTALRNKWGLWSGSPLKDYFRKLGLEHADDMSEVIIRSYHRHLNGRPLDVEGQIATCRDHWERHMGGQPTIPDGDYRREW